MNVKISPSTLHGAVTAPPSKSYAHRLLICAALARGGGTVRGISESEDMSATLDCISALGVKYSRSGADVEISPGNRRPTGADFPCRESGSTLRFFIPIALALGDGAEFTGTARLMQRGIGVYEALFAEKGIKTELSAECIRLRGRLRAGEYVLRGDVSSQFVSGLMFALPLLEGDSVIRVLPPVESRGYIDITLDAIRGAGVEINEIAENTFAVRGGQSYRAREALVEGDWSNAAALYAFNALGGSLDIGGLNRSSIQGDMACLEILDRLGAPGAEIDLSNCPDLGPVMFAVAAAKHGAVFTGTRRLRIKESDRAQAMAQELIKFGVTAEVLENSVVIRSAPLMRPTEILSAHNDHRIVMAMTLLASLTGGEISGAEAIRKSYPDFFGVLEGLGLEISYGV